MSATVRVLLVDDHPVVSEAVGRGLARGHDIDVVGEAHTLRRAREMTQQLQPDVVLLDQQLPDGDGVSAIADLLDAAPGVQVLMLTGDTREATVQAAARAGAAGFLAKGESISVVADAVRASAAGEAIVSSTQLAAVHDAGRVVGDDPVVPTLTDREHDVLKLVARGLTNPVIAEHLQLSPHTISKHVTNIATKLGARSKLQVLSLALEHGLVPPGA